MVQVQVYHLKPTRLIPNSPQPLLYYPSLFKPTTTTSSSSFTTTIACSSSSPSSTPSPSPPSLNPSKIHQTFHQNSWKTQWIFRYGPTQSSHYHTRIHECMVVLSGRATIRFGVADTSADPTSNTHGTCYEKGGVTIDAKAGDAFVIPAGVAHKTYDTSPASSLALLTPGDAHGVEVSEATTTVKETLSRIQLSGFTMMGAYPKNCGTWDFAVEGRESEFEVSWTVPKPEHDPVLGDAVEGLKGRWKDVGKVEVDERVKGDKKFAKL